MDNITPQELLRELISRYKRYYDFDHNESIKQIRRDSQALAHPDLKREAKIAAQIAIAEATARSYKKQLADWLSMGGNNDN